MLTDIDIGIFSRIDQQTDSPILKRAVQRPCSWTKFLVTGKFSLFHERRSYHTNRNSYKRVGRHGIRTSSAQLFILYWRKFESTVTCFLLLALIWSLLERVENFLASFLKFTFHSVLVWTSMETITSNVVTEVKQSTEHCLNWHQLAFSFGQA